MRLPKKDLIATGFVGVAAALYLLWVTDTAPGRLSDVRMTGILILVLGIAASAVAVVPGFDSLIHGSRTYVAITSVLGLAAFAGGLQMLLYASGTGLAVMTAAMVTLWAIASTHHRLLAERDRYAAQARLGQPSAPQQEHRVH